MKVLVSTTVWCPENQPTRYKDLKKHLDAFSTYNGTWDLLYVINETREDLEDVVGEYVKNSKATKKAGAKFTENKGWGFSRNFAIKYAVENDYDLHILMDCDLVVSDPDWIEKCIETSKVQPAFMCRMDEPQFMVGKNEVEGVKFDLYDEWIGCINVLTKEAMNKVGGYNFRDLPEMWGFHDPEFGRRLLKAELLEPAGKYPSINVGTIEHQDKDYDQLLDPMKKRVCDTYISRFGALEYWVLTGQAPVFFDYNYNMPKTVDLMVGA